MPEQVLTLLLTNEYMFSNLSRLHVSDLSKLHVSDLNISSFFFVDRLLEMDNPKDVGPCHTDYSISLVN